MHNPALSFAAVAMAFVLLADARPAWGSPQDEGAQLKEIAQLKEVFPEAVAIDLTPLVGIYEVQLGYQLHYTDAEGRYMFLSDLMDQTTGENLSENRRRAARRGLFEELDSWDPIEFKPEAPAHEIVVFTDVDCGFCRQLHGQIAQYQEAGIGVSYLAFPRAGPGSKTWQTMESIWCADDRRVAMTMAKVGLAVEAKVCESDSVTRHAELGSALGLRGTPMLLVSDGQIIPGYVPPEDLLQMLTADGGDSGE